MEFLSRFYLSSKDIYYHWDPLIVSAVLSTSPISLPMDKAVESWSPVIINKFIPAYLQSYTDSLTPSLTGS